MLLGYIKKLLNSLFLNKTKHLYIIILNINLDNNNNIINNIKFNMPKIQKLPTGQLVITIPKVLAEYEGLEKGMEVEFKKHKDGFLLEVDK